MDVPAPLPPADEPPPPPPADQRPPPPPRTRWRQFTAWAFPAGLVAAGMVAGVLLLAAFQILLEDRLGDVNVPGDPRDPAPDLIMTLSPGLLTASIRQSVAKGNSPVPLQNVRVVTKKDRVIVLGDVAVLGRGVPSTIEMRPVVEEGMVRMKVVSAKLGPLPVPGNVERIAEDPINSRVRAVVEDYPATVTSVSAGPEGVTVTARVRLSDGTATPSPSPSPTPTP